MSVAGVLDDLAARGQTLACAESLTGGLLVARLIDVPGASRVVRGAVVAYATDLKTALLGVDEALLAERGAVDPDVALAMAHGVCRVTRSGWGVATTGVAGPDPADGRPVGTAFVAVVQAPAAGPIGPGGARPTGWSAVRELRLDGDRPAIRSGVVDAAVQLLEAALAATRHTVG